MLPRALGRFLGGALALAEVARDLGEADQHAVAISCRAQHDVGPEARAVLSDPPGLFLEASGGGGQLQLAFRLSRADLLGRIEAGEVLPDDLLRGVSLDVLGPPVPGRHPAFAIEHEDGVVLHALDHQAQPLLGLAELLLCPAALGQVARDLGVADQFSIAVVDAADHDVRPEAGAVLADPPAFVLDAAILLRTAEQPPRLAGRRVLRRVEHGEIAADRFVSAVALRPLGAEVPGGDGSFGIDHEDRVIRHASDGQERPLLAPLLAASGEVARDLHVPLDRAVLHTERRDHLVGPEARSVVAHTPAFLLGAAGAKGLGQQRLGASGRAVLFRVEAVEALADDLLGRIPLDLPSARVPGEHDTLRVEQGDGAVLDALGDGTQLRRGTQRVQLILHWPILHGGLVW